MPCLSYTGFAVDCGVEHLEFASFGPLLQRDLDDSLGFCLETARPLN